MGHLQEDSNMEVSSISHVAFSSAGGAGSVAKLLNRTLLSNKVNSELVTLTDGNINSISNSHPKVFAAGYFDYLAVRKRGAGLFTTKRSRVRSDVDLTYSIAHIHWLPGVVKLEDIFQMSKKIVFTLHDYWLVTGGCHFPNGCAQFMSDCVKCPQARSPFHAEVTRQHALKKRLLRENSASVKLTAPSRALASDAETALQLPVAVIRNPIDECFFIDAADVPGVGSQKVHIALVAADLGDPRKGVVPFLDALKTLGESERQRLHLHFIGGHAPRYDDVESSDHGFVSNPKNIARLLDRMDATVVPSIDDNSPLVVGQALARGCYVLASNAGGTSEVLTKSKYGRSFRINEPEIAGSVSYLLNNAEAISLNREDRRRYAEQLFSPQAVIGSYLDLYKSF